MLSVVCPFFNEKENLPLLFERLEKALSSAGLVHELIFVNDGSTDGGEGFLKEKARTHPEVRVLEMSRRYGMTTALFAGLQAASGDLIATLDADLQNPPEEIPRLLSVMAQYDMVTGIRAKREDSWLRRVSSRIANGFRRAVLGDHIEDIGCSLRVFRKEILPCFYPYQGMHRFFPAIAEKDGFRILQVPVRHECRRHGLAKFGVQNRVWKGLSDLCGVRWAHSRKIHYQLKELS